MGEGLPLMVPVGEGARDGAQPCLISGRAGRREGTGPSSCCLKINLGPSPHTSDYERRSEFKLQLCDFPQVALFPSVATSSSLKRRAVEPYPKS